MCSENTVAPCPLDFSGPLGAVPYSLRYFYGRNVVRQLGKTSIESPALAVWHLEQWGTRDLYLFNSAHLPASGAIFVRISY
jgi:hypothetical protein